MVLIDYTKRRATATPAGNTVEIPRRHRGNSVASRQSSRSPSRTRLSNVGSSGSLHNNESFHSSSHAPPPPPRPSIEFPKPGSKTSIKASMERLPPGGGGGSSHHTPKSRLSRNKSDEDTTFQSFASTTSPRQSRKIVIPPLCPPAPDGEEKGASLVGDWIDTLKDHDSNNPKQRISGLSLGSTSFDFEDWLGGGSDPQHQQQSTNLARKTSWGSSSHHMPRKTNSGASLGSSSHHHGHGLIGKKSSSNLLDASEEDATTDNIPSSAAANNLMAAVDNLTGSQHTKRISRKERMASSRALVTDASMGDTSTQSEGVGRRISRKDRASVASSSGSSTSLRDLNASAHSPNRRISRKDRLSTASGSSTSLRDVNSSSHSPNTGSSHNRRISRKERLSISSHSQRGSTHSPNQSTSKKDRLASDAAAMVAAMDDLSASNNEENSFGGGSSRRSMGASSSGRERNSDENRYLNTQENDRINSPPTNNKTTTDNSVPSAVKSVSAAESSSTTPRFPKNTHRGKAPSPSRKPAIAKQPDTTYDTTADLPSSLLPSKPLIDRRAARKTMRTGGMDEAMPSAFNPSAFTKPSRAKKPNPFRRCDTSDLVKEHRNRRPTVLVEMDFGDDEELEMSESSEHSDTDFMTRNLDNSSKRGSNFQRTLTPAQEEQAAHDWSKPSVQTVDWGKRSKTLPGPPKAKLVRSQSDSMAGSGTRPPPFSLEENNNDDIPRPGLLTPSISMSNVFVKKPSMERSVSFTIRRRKKEGTNDSKNDLDDETNSTFAKLSESLGLDLNVNAANNLLGFTAADEEHANPQFPLEKMMNTVPIPGLKRSSSAGVDPAAVAMTPMLQRSVSHGGATSVMGTKLRRSTSAGGPTSIMGAKLLKRSVSAGLGSTNSIVATKLKRNVSGGMSGSAVSLNGVMGRRCASPASSLMDDRSGASFSPRRTMDDMSGASLSPTRGPRRTMSASFGFGVPDTKFSYEQRTEQARRERGRSPGRKKSSLKRATSVSDARTLSSSYHGGSYNHTQAPIAAQQRPSSHSPDRRRPSSYSPSRSRSGGSTPKRRPSPIRNNRRPSPNRLSSPAARSRSSSLKRGDSNRDTALGSDSMFKVAKPSRVRRHGSHGDLIDNSDSFNDDLFQSSGGRRGGMRRSTSLSHAMTAFNKGAKRRSSISPEPFKGVKRRPASLSASPERSGLNRKASDSRSPDRKHNRSKSRESLQNIIAALKNPATPKAGNNEKVKPPSKSSMASLATSNLDDSDMSHSRKSAGISHGDSSMSARAQYLAMERGHGRSDPSAGDLGFEGNDGRTLNGMHGKSRAAAKTGREEKRRQKGRSSSMNNLESTPEHRKDNAKELASERGYGKSEPAMEDLGYGNEDNEAPPDIYGKSRSSANAGRRENRRLHGRSNSMSHLNSAYGYQGRSEDNDSGHGGRQKGSLDQFLSVSHHGRLGTHNPEDDLSVASSQHSRRSRPRGKLRRGASLSLGSESKRNLNSDRREIDTSSFVTGSRIRRIDKASQLGLAR